MRSTLVVIAAALALSACGGGSEVDRGRQPVVDRTGSGAAEDQARPSAPVPDRRIILFDPRSGVMMILVNAGHSLRRTAKGRRKLTLQRRGQSYKALAEKEMDALLVSLKDRGLGGFGSAFVRGDEVYFDRKFPDPGYRGILFLEEGGRKQKVLAFRPRGEQDIVGHGRFKRFVEFKVLVYRWYNAHAESEDPSTGFTLSGSGR